MTYCAARRHGQDEMHCAVCRLTWAVDEPSVCPRGVVEAPPLVPETPLRFVSALAPDFIAFNC